MIFFSIIFIIYILCALWFRYILCNENTNEIFIDFISKINNRSHFSKHKHETFFIYIIIVEFTNSNINIYYSYLKSFSQKHHNFISLSESLFPLSWKNIPFKNCFFFFNNNKNLLFLWNFVNRPDAQTWHHWCIK